MLEEDRPPERIWLNDEELSAHFDRLSERRNSKAEGTETVPQAGLDQNELTAELRK